MCSFLFTNKKIDDISSVNFFLQKRGPDKTTIKTFDNFTLVHNLLSITGEFCEQPLIENDICLVFNGEIYNYDQTKEYKSDGYFILDCYKEYGDNFIKYLDGEFALVLLDKTKKKIYFSGDIFQTKPIYASIESEEIGISSYKSALKALGFTNIKRLIPNNSYSYDLKTKKIEYSKIYDFNLLQNIDAFDLWENAFINSLKKRTKNTRGSIIVPMSSGHDSGVIVCGLSQLKYTNFCVYSITGDEDESVIFNRMNQVQCLKKYSTKYISKNEMGAIIKNINETVEPFYYGVDHSASTPGLDDPGARGLYKILSDVKSDLNIKVQLSGQGGDEVMSNVQTYGFGGKYNPSYFPDDLSTVFPWNNFYYGSNSSYLSKEESIAGSLGIETRYPLLDKEVVQQFLNLTPRLKNSCYKAPITNFFTKNNFPFNYAKRGFNIIVQ